MKTIYKKLLFLLLLLPLNLLAQTLEGTVTDKTSKQPLPGVNVVIKGAASGTQTDFDGKFKLSGVKKGDVVIFSYLGYKNTTLAYSGQTSVAIVLEEEANQLTEVVVQVGYGSVKKKDATGAVELITLKDFNKGAITSVDGLLNGRASGVVVTSSGTPGNAATIRIRGGSSLLASNDPLIVIDGLPIDGGLSQVNPNDIESVSILKDASSTAIYGNRGSNGVIIITTKKGSKKGLQVSLNTFTTMNTLSRKVDVYTAGEYRGIILSEAADKAAMTGQANTNWQREIFKNSYTSDVSASILGNLFNKVPARLTLGNTENNGILLTSVFKRSTGSFALNPSFFDDHLKINVTGTYGYTFKREADEGAIGGAISFDPTQPVYDADSPYAGYYEHTLATGYPNTNAVSNPVAQLMERRNIKNSKRFFGNFNLDYKLHFFPDVRIILNVGVDKEEGEGYDWTNPLARNGFNSSITGPLFTTLESRQLGNYSRNWYDNRNMNYSGQLNYTKKVGKFNIDFLGGVDYQKFEYQKFDTPNKNLYAFLPQEYLKEDVYTDPGNILIGYLGRLNIGYNDKYLLTFNFRRDGSSRISDLNPWDNFFGGAFAWKLKEEFFRNSGLISDLKLRVGYGETGQQNLGEPYAWFKRYVISNSAYYQFGDEFYLIAKPAGYNKNLKWERSAKTNLGLDFGFFNNRLRGSVDGYVSKTTNLFSTTVQGALQNLKILGPANVGSLESKGVDLVLNIEAIKREHFNLNFNYNVTYNHLEITDLFSDNQPQGSLGLNTNVQVNKIGFAPFSYWVYEQIYDASGRPIEGAYVDRDGNGVINSNDKYNYKKPQADVTMGWLTNASLYNWDFSMAWRASFGNYVFDRVSAERGRFGAINNTQTNTINNTTTDYSNTHFQTNSNVESDYYVKDGTFLKLDNFTVGYNFKGMFNTEKTTLRLYGAVQNVFTITKYKGLDPEVFNNGLDGTIYPRARMFMLGVNANF
jgi:TonB-linked SusC/RagA family outer membrane protein